MTITSNQVSKLSSGGGNVVSASGGKIGSIGQIYLDNQTDEPTWVTVKTGLFGTSESFAPLADATVQGNDIAINYDKDKIKDAPRVDPDGNLSPAEEDRLYEYYGLAGTGGVDAGPVGTAGKTHDSGKGVVGHDTSGPTTDDAMTVSEEKVRVGTTQRETGRARLRKYVVTENVTKTVPVSHEEVRLEREPITDANRGAAHDGPAISEEEHEVVLHSEEPVVEKDVEAVERVRLNTETVSDEATVTDEVRKERVEVDEDGKKR
ncbi:YsnF/AvaK domain-containing protein [Williamsia muralis]|uniref:YsnF/AvaK domain-containing protein n=1 Tax=Williamsia marianensis TaxID=85044 RepID=UPI003F16ABE4